jgi:hypothetical protein
VSVAIAAPPAPQELDRRRMNLIFVTVMLQDWGAEDDQLLGQAMGNIAREIVDEDPIRAPTPELAVAAR